MVKYKQIMQVSLCGNIERGAFDAVTVSGAIRGFKADGGG